MKFCEKCQSEYDDTQDYCMGCDGPLVHRELPPPPKVVPENRRTDESAKTTGKSVVARTDDYNAGFGFEEKVISRLDENASGFPKLQTDKGDRSHSTTVINNGTPFSRIFWGVFLALLSFYILIRLFGFVTPVSTEYSRNGVVFKGIFQHF